MDHLRRHPYRAGLALVLLVQAVLTLRLRNTPLLDESLYLYIGRLQLHAMLRGGPVPTAPDGYFSGAPELYPAAAAAVDAVGGLQLVRFVSLLFMLSATGAVAWTARALVGGRAAVYAAAVFALSASVIQLGGLATFDAPAFAMVAWGAAVGAWSSARDGSLRWGLVVGAVLTLAAFTKYSAAIDIPFVLLLMLVAGWRTDRRRAVQRAVLAGTAVVVLGGGSLATFARPLVVGLRYTTTQRTAFLPDSRSALLHRLVVWDGLPLLLGLLGALLLVRRRPVLALLLGVGGVAAPLYQVHLAEVISLNKHVVLGLLLGVPLAGALLAAVPRRAVAVVPLVLAALAWQGVRQSSALYRWPDLTPLVGALRTVVTDHPGVRMTGEQQETPEYRLRTTTEAYQWTSIYGSFAYDGKVGLEAYRQAFRDDWFQVAFLDGSVPISKVLQGEMQSYGYTSFSVSTPDGHDTWRVWTRYPSEPPGPSTR